MEAPNRILFNGYIYTKTQSVENSSNTAINESYKIKEPKQLTLSMIRRLNDGKVFSVYFRTGIVDMDKKLDGHSHWISNDDEELRLDYISSNEFEPVEFT